MQKVIIFISRGLIYVSIKQKIVVDVLESISQICICSPSDAFIVSVYYCKLLLRCMPVIGTTDFAVSDSCIQRPLLLLIRFELEKEIRDRAVSDNWPSSR
jgi:hypothetical protein